VANFIDAFQPESGINLEDLVGIFAGTTDPRTGEAAPIGSLFLQSSGHLYQKVGALDTEWNILAFGIGQTVKISSTDTSPGYLSGKLQTSSALTATVQNAGGDETLLLDLSNVGTAGTYTKVTTNAKGQVTVGSNPTTLSGYGIVDAQPLDSDLTALAAINSVGLYAITGSGTSSTRVLTGTPTQINVQFGNGLNGNPTLSLPSTELTFPGTEGVFFPAGTIAQRVDTLGATRFNTDSNVLEYYNGVSWVSLVASTLGTVTSVAVTVPSGLSVSGSPITTSGTLAFSLANDLAAIEALPGTGFAVRTGTDTWDTVGIYGTLNRIDVSNNLGESDVGIDISASYAGQTSITTLGTITTGFWGGTTIGTLYGGTGRTSIGAANTVLSVNTTGTALEYKLISGSTGLNVQFAGGSIQLTNTGVTSLFGTANQINTTAATGSITLSLPQNIGTTSSPTFAQITVSNDPTLPLQVATKQYVDNAIQGLNVKGPVRVGTTSAITLSGEQTIDGVPVVSGDRVLVKNQGSAAANGVYVVDTGAWTRAIDVDTWTEVPSAFVFIEEGDTLSETGWLSTADAGGTLDSTAMPWVQFSSAGVVTAGTGLTKSGNVLSITSVGTAGTYNNVTTNSQGQVISGSTVSYLTGNQNIQLQGDVTSNAAPNLLTTSLSLTGVTAGTYQSVTVDAKGRVFAGSNPTTLAEYGITDAQPLDPFLTNISSLPSNGFLVYDGDIGLVRTIVAGSNRISVVNGSGVSGNPTIDLDIANININELGNDPLNIASGGTNLTTLGSSNQLLSVNQADTGLEYRTLSATGITITFSDGGIHLATDQNGTVTSVAVTTGTGLSVTGSPITSSGTFDLQLNSELVGLTSPTGLGLVTRTAAGTYVERTVVSGNSTITITNGAGTTGNIALDLALIGTASTYTKVTTDAFGRVTSGTNPTTLAGYGITDAQPLSSYLTNLDALSSAGIVVKSGGTAITRTITAGSAKIAVSNGSGVSGNPTVDLGSVALEDLSDVFVTAPTADQALVWNGSSWVNASVKLKLYAEAVDSEVTPVVLGVNAVAIGSEATAGVDSSFAIGPQSLSRHPGLVHAQGRFGSQGDAQTGEYILRTSTINGTPGVEMFLDGVNGSQRLVMPTDSTWVWEATIVAHRTDVSGEHAGFRLKGVMFCAGSLNSITMLGAPSKEILARTNGTWDVSASVDTVQGSLKLSVTGSSGQTIRWMAVVKTTEVTN
jgi:phage-related tail fiber protein